MSVLVRMPEPARDDFIDADLETVEGAIRLVEAGAANRVVLVNLGDAASVLSFAIAAGQQVGVTVRGDRSMGQLAIEVMATQ
jgi:hypothetical protein